MVSISAPAAQGEVRYSQSPNKIEVYDTTLNGWQIPNLSGVARIEIYKDQYSYTSVTVDSHSSSGNVHTFNITENLVTTPPPDTSFTTVILNWN